MVWQDEDAVVVDDWCRVLSSLMVEWYGRGGELVAIEEAELRWRVREFDQGKHSTVMGSYSGHYILAKIP